MLTIDENCTTFSDDTHIWFDNSKPKDILMRPCEADHSIPLDDTHAKVMFSNTAIIIYLTAGPLPSRGILLSAPVTVGDVFKALSDFYSTELTAAEHTALKDWKYGDDLEPSTQSEKLYHVYGDIQYKYWYEGLRKRVFGEERKRLWRSYADVATYPPLTMACKHTCEVYRTYDVKWAS